jgi:microcystin-dependent protein
MNPDGTQDKLANRREFAELLSPLTNREADGKFTLPQDGWYHGLPAGEFPNVETLPDGTIRRAIQVLDDKAFGAMKNAFEAAAKNPNFAGLLVDFDHFSDDLDKSSEAGGWITAWQNRDNGAWWQIRWSDVGDAAVRNGRFRFLSGVFPAEGWEFIEPPLRNAKEKTITMKIRPLRLGGAGLTNKPNLRGMVPLSNRSSSDGPVSQPTERKSMNRIAAFVGLSAEASEDAILAELTKLKNRAETAEQANAPLKNKVTDLENQNVELLDGQIAAELDAHGISDEPKRAALIPVLKPMKNREARLGFLKTVIGEKKTAAAAAARPLTNRQTAKTPDQAASADTEEDPAKQAAQREKEVREYALRNRCTNAEAWDAVRRDKPELFGITVGN